MSFQGDVCQEWVTVLKIFVGFPTSGMDILHIKSISTVLHLDLCHQTTRKLVKIHVFRLCFDACSPLWGSDVDVSSSRCVDCGRPGGALRWVEAVLSNCDKDGYPPRKLTWQWKINHEWRCLSYSKEGLSKKTKMEPENHRFEREKHLQTTNFEVPC